MAIVQRKYEDELIWQAMREAGLSVEDVQVRDVYAIIDDERPDQENAVFRVSFEWTPTHAVALRVLERARELENENPLRAPSATFGEEIDFQ
jgi:hypothetical protein